MQHDMGLERFAPARSGGVAADDGARYLPGGVSGHAGQPPFASIASLEAPGARLLLSLSEAVVLAVTSVVTDFAYHKVFLHSSGMFLQSLATGIAVALLYCGAMHMLDGSRRLRAPLSVSALMDVTVVWIASILMVTFFVFAIKASGQLSRGAMLTYLAFGYAAVLATRSIVPAFLAAHYRPARLASTRALVVGAAGSEACRDIVSELRKVGFPVPEVVELRADCSDAEWHADLPAVLGRIYALTRVMGHGDVCLAAGGLREAQLHDLINALQVIPHAVRVIPDPAVERLLHLPLRNVGSLYSVELQRAPMNEAQRFGKRALDLGISIPLLVFIAPLLGAIAIAIKLDSRGPVMFRQKRLGYRGKAFEIFKFRSMSVLENGEEIAQATKGDNRVTRVGRWLRTTSLDELPQLLNVVRGDMSLVGPRPHAVAHDKMFSTLVDHYEVRQHVKPGISGWAQVNGLRGETASIDAMRKRVEFDLQYAKNASLWFDIKILFLTVVEVLRQRNAY